MDRNRKGIVMWMSIISGFIAMASAGFVGMSGIFAAGGIANNDAVKKANIVMYSSFLAAITIIVLHIYGQSMYHSVSEGESQLIPLLLLFAGIPINLPLLRSLLCGRVVKNSLELFLCDYFI